MEPNGDFYPCCVQVGLFPAINFRDVGVEEAFKNILEGYKINKEFKAILKRLEKVEKRGRYKRKAK